jgi:ribosomal protein S18 acetylase RimI-like enzyme
MNLHIRILNNIDLESIAMIHIVAFPKSALTKLGFEAVRRYYEWQIIGPHDSVNIGAFKDRELVGFCFGGIFRGSLGGFLEKNRNFLILQVIIRPWLLLNPLFRDRIQFATKRVFHFLSPAKKETESLTKVSSIPPMPSFGILSIGVLPQYQGLGTSKFLMEYSEDEAKKRGFTKMNLTVHPSNGRAVRFYEKMGWQKDIINGDWNGHMSKFLSN